MSDKVYIFDEIEAAQPDAARLRGAYLERYAPMAKAQGMTLEGAWTSPPVELADRATTLHFMWSVADVGAWWAMRLGAERANPENDVPLDGHQEKIAWWGWVDGIAISRRRTFLRDIAEAADV